MSRPLAFQAYLVTCLPTGKHYIGITTHSLRRRWVEHVSNAARRPLKTALYSAILKHGRHSFTIEPLCSANSWADLCAIEIELIKQWNTIAPHGYNLTLGGEGVFGYKHTADQIERSAAKHRGKSMPDSQREKISAWLLGRKKSPLYCSRIASAKRGIKRTAETCAKIAAARLGKSNNPGEINGGAKLTVAQVRDARIRLAAGESQRSIARSLNIHYNAIWKIAHGLKWGSIT